MEGDQKRRNWSFIGFSSDESSVRLHHQSPESKELLMKALTHSGINVKDPNHS